MRGQRLGSKLSLVAAALLALTGAASAADRGDGASGAAAVKLDHVSFWVSDLDRSTRFYRDALGFRPLGDGGEIATPDVAPLLGRDHEVRLRLRRFERDGFNLTLVQYASGKDVDPNAKALANQPGAAALSFDVKDLEPMMAKAGQAGGTLRGQIVLGEGRIVLFSDPDGYLIEFNERP